jgi:ribosome biogenesis GTPase / thiamine phosphate phosphatase
MATARQLVRGHRRTRVRVQVRGDCAHGSEPGCAVRAAIEAGAPEVERLESYFKLRREIERHVRLSDPRAMAEANRRLRAMHRTQYSMPNKRDP